MSDILTEAIKIVESLPGISPEIDDYYQRQKNTRRYLIKIKKRESRKKK